MMAKVKVIQMIDFKLLFENEKCGVESQRKVFVNSAIGVYFGYSDEGFLRLSFLSKEEAPRLESTRNLRVTQGVESSEAFWTCFDLLSADIKNVFYTFCENMVESVTGVTVESKALNCMKRRYISWKSMFRGSPTNTLSNEVLRGLYGELYYLKTYMIEKYGIQAAINSWGGPEAKSKDFSVGQEWYEIKAVGANTAEIHISSLAQLSSPYDGHLVIIRIEAMSREFNSGDACIKELLDCILNQIYDETTEGIFLSKISSYGIQLSDECITEKFCVKSVDKYLVNRDFPRICEKDISVSAIKDVSYSLIVNALKEYREE